MAKVTFEERAWSDPRLTKLSIVLEVPEEVCVGVLLTLWHYTQEQLAVKIQRRDLELGLHKVSAWLKQMGCLKFDHLVDHLLDANYLIQAESGYLKVKGNGTRVDKVRHLRNQCRTAAASRWNQNSAKQKNRAKKGISLDSEMIPDISDDANLDASRHADSITFSEGLGMRSAARDKENKRIREVENKREKDITAPQGANLNFPPVVNFQPESEDHIYDVEEKQKSSGRKRAIAGKAKGSTETSAAICTGEVIGAYCQSYKKRYGTNPPITGKSSGIVKRLVKDVGTEKAKKIVDTYLKMDDSWFITRSHDLSTLEGNLTKVATFSETGKIVSMADARAQERRSSSKSAVESFLSRDTEDVAPWEVR